jgi:hypothetical protein
MVNDWPWRESVANNGITAAKWFAAWPAPWQVLPFGKQPASSAAPAQPAELANETLAFIRR